MHGTDPIALVVQGMRDFRRHKEGAEPRLRTQAGSEGCTCIEKGSTNLV